MRGHRNDHRDQVDDFGRYSRNYDEDKASRPVRPTDRDGGRERRSPPKRSNSRDRVKRTINSLSILRYVHKLCSFLCFVDARVDRDVRHTDPYGPVESRVSEPRPSATLVLKGISGQTTEHAVANLCD